MEQINFSREPLGNCSIKSCLILFHSSHLYMVNFTSIFQITYKEPSTICCRALLKTRMALLIPQRMLNGILLRFPILYRTKFINYESYLADPSDASKELLERLNSVLEIEGDVIECGSARCGTTAIMAKHLKDKLVRKKVYACDLFGGGFDKTELANERKMGLTDVGDNPFTYNSYQYVVKKLSALGLSEYVVLVKGLFQDTLPNLGSKFCFCLVDCDLKSSMSFCAETIWRKLCSNGLMVFDDYRDPHFKGAKLAIEEFVTKYDSCISEHGLLKRLYYVKKK